MLGKKDAYNNLLKGKYIPYVEDVMFLTSSVRSIIIQLSHITPLDGAQINKAISRINDLILPLESFAAHVDATAQYGLDAFADDDGCADKVTTMKLRLDEMRKSLSSLSGKPAGSRRLNADFMNEYGNWSLLSSQVERCMNIYPNDTLYLNNWWTGIQKELRAFITIDAINSETGMFEIFADSFDYND